MWLYSIGLLTIFACLACCSAETNLKKRMKQGRRTTKVINHRRRNRLLPVEAEDDEKVVIPMKIPKLTTAQKIAMIIESGQDPFEKKRKRSDKNKILSRQPRHARRYPKTGYEFIDDDSDELRWDLDTLHATLWDEVNSDTQNWKDSDQSKNFDLRSEVTATEDGKRPFEWERTSHVSHWETSPSPAYWETSIPEHSAQNSFQTFTSQSSVQENYDATQEILSTTAISTPNITSSTQLPMNAIKDSSWKQFHDVKSSSAYLKPLALPMKNCPHRFDAVTRAFNGRTYVFARDRVYEIWRRNNFNQKASFFVNEMFPKGPRTVTAAYTNYRSGVTILIEHQTVYRYRWNRKKKFFFLARKSPEVLTKTVTLYPRAGFQWIDGNQVLVEGDNFVTFDPYWNLATFAGKMSDYFPYFPIDLIGSSYQNGSLFILYTASNRIQASI
ncbi:unnamed protein product [Thelazia callipaeda]|uniref:Uncharacterized protein n=1 Tax=Thelazia callipaeda TaxID=103827 RepID=A0A0N5CS48_THECL|nr:unnamed protein product [Thelazia callipaeda]